MKTEGCAQEEEPDWIAPVEQRRLEAVDVDAEQPEAQAQQRQHAVGLSVDPVVKIDERHHDDEQERERKTRGRDRSDRRARGRPQHRDNAGVLGSVMRFSEMPAPTARKVESCCAGR